MQKYEKIEKREMKNEKNLFPTINLAILQPINPFFQNRKHPVSKKNFQPLSVHIVSTFQSYKHLYPTASKIAFDFQCFIIYPYSSATYKRYKPTSDTFPKNY